MIEYARLAVVKLTRRCAVTHVDLVTAKRYQNLPKSLIKNYGDTDLDVYEMVFTGGEIHPADEMAILV